MKKKSLIIITFVLILVVLSVAIVTISVNSYNNSLVGRANKFEVLEGNILRVIDSAKEETKEEIKNLRDEFMILFEKGEYEECAKILNKANKAGIAILLTTEINEPEERQLQLFAQNNTIIFDMLEDIGWDKINWDEEKQKHFVDTQFKYVWENERGRAECRRKNFEMNKIPYLDKLPESIKNLISLSEEELEEAELFRDYKMSESAINKAESTLEYTINYEPDSLSTSKQKAVIDMDKGVVEISFNYSYKHGIYGGRQFGEYEYTYEIPKYYLEWDFIVDHEPCVYLFQMSRN